MLYAQSENNRNRDIHTGGQYENVKIKSVNFCIRIIWFMRETTSGFLKIL